MLLDFDGTLAPLARRPALAKLSPARRKMLAGLTRRPGLKLAVISGRKLSVVRRLVGLERAIYLGNHGFEALAGGRYWVLPAARRYVKLLRRIRSSLKTSLRYPGLLVEDKELTLSVHFRALPPARLAAFKKDFTRALAPWRNAVKVTTGKKVFEVRPPLAWNKGKAVRWLIKRLGPGEYYPVYIGDDRTDEDAFRALRGRGLTYRVGRPAATAARYHLKNVAAVYGLLKRLEELPCC